MGWVNFVFELLTGVLAPTDLNPGEDDYLRGVEAGKDYEHSQHDSSSSQHDSSSSQGNSQHDASDTSGN